MGSGYVGILNVELHFPEAGSLKGKRKHVKSAKAQLQNRFGASVAEVEHHELWQRAGLTMACVAREYGEAERLLDDPDPQVRGAAVWAVGRLAPETLPRLATRRLARESDPDVLAEWRMAVS